MCVGVVGGGDNSVTCVFWIDCCDINMFSLFWIFFGDINKMNMRGYTLIFNFFGGDEGWRVLFLA